MKKSIRSVTGILLALALVITCFPGAAFAGSRDNLVISGNRSLEDGVYLVKGSMVKPDKVSKSMADNAINHNIMVTVKDGKYKVTMNFEGMKIGTRKGYLGKLSYFLTGYKTDKYSKPVGPVGDTEVVKYQMDSNGKRFKDQYGTDYPDRVSFELIPEALADGYVPLQVFVPVMESIAEGVGTQVVLLSLDWDSAEKTDADDKRFDDPVDVNEKTAKGVKNSRITASAKAGRGYISLSWKKSKGYRVDGYEVFRSTKKTKGYGTKAFFKTKKTSYRCSKALKKGRTYYFKVRGYRMVDGKKVYTKWSPVVSRKAI